MSDQSQSKCSQCGAPLAADVPGRLCLRCLLEFGLKREADCDADEIPSAAFESDPFPGYQLLEKIGEGGCGVVYRAAQLQPLRREVAIKVIKLGMDTRTVITRFGAERQALALMDHPNIARVFDAGVTGNGRPFFVMELVSGERITDYCDGKQMSVSQRLELFLQVCHAVQHAHQKGIIHRDLKPSNILVIEQDGKAASKVIDFGIAKAIGQQRLADQTLYTAFEQCVGTPAYMSPEQAGLTAEDIDTRSDIYSLGVLLYELLTGRPPFEHDRLRRAALGEICRIIREEEPSLPSARLTTLTKAELTETAQCRLLPGQRLVSELRGDLDWLVMKALEKDRERRYDTANGLADDILRHLRNEPISARPPSALYRFQKMASRNKLVFGSAVVVTFALVAGLAVSTWMFFREKQARERLELRAYQSDMDAAARMAAVHVGGLAGAVKLLESWRHHLPDLRGWEWYYLNGLCHRDLLTIRADSNTLWSVTWSPDGKRLATGGAEGTVKIWDATDGRQLQALTGHTGEVMSVVWSPNGRWLASAGKDKTVKIWQLEAGGVSTLTGHRETVDCLGWSPDSKMLASGSFDGTVKIWNAASGAMVQTFAAVGQVFSLSWNNDGTRLVAAGNSHLFKCWDVPTGRELWTASTNAEANSLAVAWSPDGTQLANGGFDNSVSFCDAATGTNLISFWDSHNVVLSVAWNPDGTRLASATRGDGRIAIRDISAGGKVIRDFRGHLGSVQCVYWRPDGSQIASASADGTVKIWDVKNEDPSNRTLNQPDQVPALAWSPDGTKLAAGSRRTSAWIWDLSRTATPIALRGGYTTWTWSVAWNPAGTRLASGGADGLEVWDASTFAEIWQDRNSIGEIHAVVWSPDGKRIAAVGNGSKLTVWDSMTGKSLDSLALPPGWSCCLAWSPDGGSLACGVGSKIYIWDDRLTLQRILTGHRDTVNCLAWSPDGMRLASAGNDTSAKIWDVRRGKEINTLLGHTASIDSLAWNPEGTRLVTGSWDLSIKIWDTQTGAEVCSFDKPGGIVQMIYAVTWSRDGRRIACSDIEGDICILDSTPGWLGENVGKVSTATVPVRNPRADTIRSLKFYCESVEPHATNNADALRRLAWIRATSRYPELRDGRKAVAFAEQALALCGGRNAGVTSILAAAYAEAGDFPKAISMQKQAMALLPTVELKAEYAPELKLYESHQPCRDDSW